jgi:hypothetical protein
MRRAVRACGRDWTRLAAHVGGGRSASNLQWYYARARKRLGLDALADEAEERQQQRQQQQQQQQQQQPPRDGGGGGGGGSAGKRARGE